MDRAGKLIRQDTFLSKKISAKFESFESSGESDVQDLKDRLSIMKNTANERVIGNKETKFGMKDIIIEITNHVSQVMDKFKRRKKEMITALRVEVNYQIAIKVNKVTQDLAAL